MKLLRLGALVGSIVLLVATSITMINKRSEARSELDDRATAAAFVAAESTRSTIDRAAAVVAVAAESSDVTDLSDGTLDAMVASFPGASACVVDAAGERCTGPSLLATEAFEDGTQESIGQQGAPVVAADEATESVLVVASDAVAVALSLPADQLVSAGADDAISELEATTSIRVSSSNTSGVEGPTSADGEVSVTTAVAFGGTSGSVIVQTAVVDDVGLFGDNFALYAALLGLGTVLMALAGGTFLAERRSLERRATTDELTGLVNRREFERMSEIALFDSSRFGTGLCVMLVDLNGFKQINDTLGHQFGDLVLEACADRLVGAVRDSDVVGRWGGDEFVILLPGLEDGSAVRRSAERIAGQLSASPVVGDVSISGAIGAALYPRHGETLEELMRSADVAMYEAKSSGVSHRLADAVTIDLARETVSDQYVGPERRRHPANSDVEQLR